MATAWTNFTVVGEDGKQKRFKPGDEVSAGDLGISDEEFEELEAVGAVRDQEYPPVGADQSPVEWAKEQLANLSEEGGDDAFFQEATSNLSQNTPQMNEMARAAMEKVGYDPEKGPEEQSLKDTVDEDAEEKAAATTAASASNVKPASTVAPTGTSGAASS